MLRGPVTVIDVETTGFTPYRGDRVIEIAAVRVQPCGTIDREFTSLIDARRDVGTTRVHGIRASDLRGAPQFAEIAAELIGTFEGSVALAGHNVRFDRMFVEHEFARINVDLGERPYLCTMEGAGGGSLSVTCAEYGVMSGEDAHHALADARATAQLLVKLARKRPLDYMSYHQPMGTWPCVIHPSKPAMTREISRQRQSEPPTFLQTLLSRNAGAASIADEGACLAYAGLLDRILEDRAIDESEADALVDVAGRWGLSGTTIAQAHRDYLRSLTRAAIADGVVTQTERADLHAVAKLLGIQTHGLDVVIDQSIERLREIGTSHAIPPSAASTTGQRVCFTGAMTATRNGRPVTREEAETLATQFGLIVQDNVTKKLDILVVADPHTQSSKAQKAREYGKRVIAEAAFWSLIGIKVD